MEFAITGITLFTSEMEKMAAFYRDVLGLELVEDTPDWKMFNAGNCRLALHKGKSRVGARPPKIGFYAKDIAKAKAWLEARGAKLGKINASEIVSFCNGKDPDGNVYAITNRPFVVSADAEAAAAAAADKRSSGRRRRRSPGS